MVALPRMYWCRTYRYLINHEPLSPGYAGALMCSGLTAYAALKRLADQATRAPFCWSALAAWV